MGQGEAASVLLPTSGAMGTSPNVIVESWSPRDWSKVKLPTEVRPLIWPPVEVGAVWRQPARWSGGSWLPGGQAACHRLETGRTGAALSGAFASQVVVFARGGESIGRFGVNNRIGRQFQLLS